MGTELKRISLEDFLFMDFRLRKGYEGTGRLLILHLETLREHFASPFRKENGLEVYHDDFAKAASLSEITSDPSITGILSMRFGTVLGCVFLMANGYEIIASDEEIYDSAMKVACKEWGAPELADWFRIHATKNPT